MKKLLGIVVLGLLWSNITFASFVHFNKWLYDNGHHQYLNLDEPTEGVCATEPKYSQVWFQNSCDGFLGTTNLNIKVYSERKSEIPILVSDDDGQDWEYDMSDIDEIDPIFDILQDINNQGIIGVA